MGQMLPAMTPFMTRVRQAGLVVAYGTRELPELCRQSIEYGRRWTERDLPGRLLPVDGADHFTILDALARPEGVLSRTLLAMLGR